MAFAVEYDETTDPEQVLLLRPVAVMKRPQLVANPVEETGLGSHANSLPTPIDALISQCSITYKGLRREQSTYATKLSLFAGGKNRASVG
jgi:hypothetical protein